MMLFLAFIDMPELLSNMMNNYQKWKQFDEEGYSTLADIRKLQLTTIPYNSVVKAAISKQE